jgi:hypothetical protein
VRRHERRGTGQRHGTAALVHNVMLFPSSLPLLWPSSHRGHHRQPTGGVLEKEEVVVDQGGRYDNNDEYEGDRGPAFTPPTMPRTGNHGAAGAFNHGDHGAAVVGSRVAAAGGLGDPTGGLQLRSRRTRRGGGQVSRGVRWQWAASEI